MAAATVSSNSTGSPKDTTDRPASAKPTSRRKFSITIPSRATNGNLASLKTPTHAGLKSPDEAYNSSDGVPAKNGRRRGLSNSSADQDTIMADLNENEVVEAINPRKRGSTDTVDYPRRRATIAVRYRMDQVAGQTQLTAYSARSVEDESHDAMERNLGAGSVLNSTLTVSIASLASN